jgi:hypothetical protein
VSGFPSRRSFQRAWYRQPARLSTGALALAALKQ